MPRSFAAYVGGLSITSLGLLSFYAPHVQPTDWTYLVVLSVLAVVLDLLEMELPGGYRLTLASAVHLSAVLLAGIPTALWVTAVSIMANELLVGKKPWLIAFNVSQGVLEVFLAGYVFVRMGGQVGSAFGEPFAALGAASIYFFLNVTTMAVAFRLLRGIPFQRSLRNMLLEQSGITYLLVVVMGLLAVYLTVNRAWFYLSLVMLLIFLARQAFKSYLELYKKEELRRQELSAVLNATHSAIAFRDQTGALRLVNRQYLQWAGLDTGGAAQPNTVSEHTIRRTPPGRALLAAGRSLQSQQEDGSTAGVLRLDLPEVRFADYHRVPVGTGEDQVGHVEVFTDITALKEAEEQMRLANEAMLRALTAAIDARDPYTHGHSSHVAEYSVVIARQLKLGEAELTRLRYAALLHDIGKLGVDDRVLRKHGPLTPEERALMMEHPVIGAELLEKAGVFTELIPGVRYHHEWYNGGGYPDGLKGEEIPFDARIIAVADAFDAMTSDRPYRRALTQEEALARLQAGREVQFDAEMVNAFAEAYAAGEVERARERLAQVLAPSPRPGDPKTDPEAGVIRPVHQKELGILYRIAKESYSRLGLRQTLRRILEICVDSVGNHIYMVFLTDPETGELVLEGALAQSNDLPEALRLDRGQGIVGRVAETGRTVRLQEVDPQPGAVLPLDQTRSLCAVPLIHDGQVIGVFNVESPLPGAFSRDDQYLLEALAQQVANAVELVRYHDQLVYAASHDGLTRALNHSAFYRRLTAAVEEARLQEHPLSLVIVDLNNMKAVNDNYGHLAGDYALKEWANLLLSHVRPQDSVARYGGDEFAIIMPGANRRQAEELVSRLARIGARTFRLDGRVIHLPRASFGIACYPEDGGRPAELVAWADHQMYAHKGRNPTVLLGDGGNHAL